MSSAGRIAIFMITASTVAACAAKATSNVRSPLAAELTPGAVTGAPVALRFDPTAKVIVSTAAGLPPATYLPSQADRGMKVYQQTCALCHAGGELIGERFVNSWNNRRLYDLYALVRSTMPLDNPGGMKEGEYIDVIAYLLQANKHAAAGRDSLRSDSAAMRKTRIALTTP